MDRRKFLKAGALFAAAAVVPKLGCVWIKQTQADRSIQGPPYDEEDPPLPGTDLPILFLVNENQAAPFGRYLGEILRAEGFNGFAAAGLGEVDLEVLKSHDLVILTPGPLSQSRIELLVEYVRTGGRLVAVQPEPAAAALFGLESLSSSQENVWLLTDPAHPLARGISATPLRLHVRADLYQAAGAQVVAWLSAGQTYYPALTLHPLEQGWAAAWTYDLPHSIVLTRQGNPALAGQETDGFSGVRPMDLFYDWLDLDNLQTPHADEQQRLFSNLLHHLSQDRRPLVRLWYFPERAASVLVATGDSHNNSAAAIQDVCRRVEKYGGTISIYYQPPDASLPGAALARARWAAAELGLTGPTYLPSPAQIRDLRDRGHEFTVHPVIYNGLESGWQRTSTRFTRLGYGPVSATTRIHDLVWEGWVETARFQAAQGVRMSLEFTHLGWMFKRGEEWPLGFFAGSGLPMKFVDESGRVLDIYQQVTHISDEHLIEMPWLNVAGLLPEQAVKLSRDLFETSLNGAYSALGASIHADLFDLPEPWYTRAATFLDGILTAAAELGLPVLNAERWLGFTEARNATGLADFGWDGSRLLFTLDPPPDAPPGLGLLVPILHGALILAAVEAGGKSLEVSTRRVGGVDFALVVPPPGRQTLSALYQPV